MGIEEGEEVQGKWICNIFKKIIAESFPNHMKEMSIEVEEDSRTPNRHDQNTASPWHIIIKIIRTESRERILRLQE
jgi:hypothetical protein